MPASVTSSVSRITWIVLAYLAGLTLFRLWFSTQLELVPDEAYYWEWSRHLDLCYRDKGPGIAWAIALGTAIMGPTGFGVRWIGVLLAGGTGWFIYSLARRLFDDKTGLIAVLIASIIPIFAIGSVVMTIDSLSVFFWAMAANLAWTAFQTNRKLHWTLLGLAIGCGFLAKFTNVLQVGALFLFLLWVPSKRRLIFSAGTLYMLAAFALCTLPILYWNITNHWPNVRALSSRSGVDTGFRIHPMQLVKFLTDQALAISPLLFIGMLVAGVGLWISRSAEERIRFLICDYFIVYGCFLFFSLNAAGKGNWTAPALISGTILLIVFWRQRLAASRGWWPVIGLALFLSFAETAVMHNTSWLGFKAERDPLQRAKGWEDLARHAEKWSKQYNCNFIIANHYSVASVLAFYLPDHPAVFTPTSSSIDNEYGLWPGYEAGPDTSALFVTKDVNGDTVPGILQLQFKHIQLLEKFYTTQDGIPVRQMQIFLCTNREATP